LLQSIPKLGARGGGWSAPCPGRFNLGKDPGTHCTGGWVAIGAGLDTYRKTLPTGGRTPDRPALSGSLYRLRYPGLGIRVTTNKLYRDTFLLNLYQILCVNFFLQSVVLGSWVQISKRRLEYFCGYPQAPQAISRILLWIRPRQFSAMIFTIYRFAIIFPFLNPAFRQPLGSLRMFQRLYSSYCVVTTHLRMEYEL
jgi:hypothetical protein